jgi:hypothetical protein
MQLVLDVEARLAKEYPEASRLPPYVPGSATCYGTSGDGGGYRGGYLEDHEEDSEDGGGGSGAAANGGGGVGPGTSGGAGGGGGSAGAFTPRRQLPLAGSTGGARTVGEAGACLRSRAA